MGEYGLTKKGPNIKRLDTIIDEMHTDLSDAWGVNTRQNPESLINHMLTNIADRIAELWEFGEHIYYSQYPSSAEGVSLDNAAQFGGSVRREARRSYYPIHCTGKNGTLIKKNVLISTITSPEVTLFLENDSTITSESFNKVDVKVLSVKNNEDYIISIDDDSCTYRSNNSDNEAGILEGIKNAFLANAELNENFTVETITGDTNILRIESNDITSRHRLFYTNNMTTDSVTSIIVFSSIETGDINITKDTIKQVKSREGSDEFTVVNLCDYVPGNDEETDVELRKSYADKIFGRSSLMLESISSSILNKVPGVVTVTPYENTSNETDEYGRPPHSIEIVVEGGDETEIAKQIFESKAAGISTTYGNNTEGVREIIIVEKGEEIQVEFSRPEKVYVWLKLDITRTSLFPTNYQEIIDKVIFDNIGELKAGESVYPQKFISDIYKNCPGINYIDIKAYHSMNDTDAPDSNQYDEPIVDITPRQKAIIKGIYVAL